jgi:predicted HTH transcriptional regulator
MSEDFFEIQSLQEDYDIEFKQASGRDGKGKLPKNFWETYSAMANTSGGYIFFGIKEQNGTISEIIGIKNIAGFKKELWDGLHNPQKVSANILTEQSISVGQICNKDIIKIYIPQAVRKHRPIYINGNPFKGTYRRNFEGDYLCTDDVVKQMLGEQTTDTRDAVLMQNYNIQDIEIETLSAYRQNFVNRQPTHPFNDYDNIEFLRNIGGWTRDRQTGQEGLTLAGLIMFGKLRSILDAIPNYIVDYQERPRALTENRWIDRLTTDYSWSGNLYDFYRRVINKLYYDLKVPFTLKGDERIDDTPIHEALREALVNTIIHADYSGRCSILVVKRTDLFGFRNPGLLRVPKQEAIKGGVSDCRNRNLQKMFQLIGRGDQAGSGFPKIYRGWSSQHWKSPDLEERIESNQTILVLSMTSLLPENIVDEIKQEIGSDFDSLNQRERIALVTARTEKCVTHSRLKELTKEHPADLTRALHGLVEKNLLESEGSGRATFYYLPGEHPISDKLGISSRQELLKSVHKSNSSEHKSNNSEHKGVDSILAPIIGKKRVNPDQMKDVIHKLCREKELTNKEIASLVQRSEDTIRTHYLTPMCEQGLITRKYPNITNHPDQKYLAK